MRTKIEFRDELLAVQLGEYPNGRTSIWLFDERNNPYMKATVNIPDVVIDDDEVIIKNYAENEGILEVLINERIVFPTGRMVRTGYTECPVCILTIKA